MHDAENKPSLRMRAWRRFFVTILVLSLLLFLPAGTLRYWPAWIFLALQMLSWGYFFLVLMKRDPKLVERRLQAKEKDRAQGIILKIFSVFLYAGLILSGLDFRFGWSRSHLGRLQLALIIIGQAGVVASYGLIYWVMLTNTFASSTIQVESGQRVIDTGPYARVRHPMYSGMVVTMLCCPLALGSYFALPVFAFIVPVLVARLLHEERTLRRDLAGYTEYCARVRFRLVPGLW